MFAALALKFKKFAHFAEATKLEIKHIKFLSRKEVLQISAIVVVATGIFSVIFGLFDLVIRFALKTILMF